MLSEHVLELLTAFVDGELDSRQRKAVMQVLEQSSEAREVLRQLQENAHKLKKLPQRKVEPSLVAEIMEAIAEQQAPSRPAVKKASRRAWLPYVAAAMAASLLVAVIGLAYWKMVGEDVGPAKLAKDVQPAPGPIKSVEPNPNPEVPPKKKKHPLLDSIWEGVAKAVGTAPVEPLSFASKFDQLVDPKGSSVARLADELTRAKSAVRVDVTVKNNAIAMNRLRMVLKEQGIKVVTDPAVSKALGDKKPPKVEYLVFAENLNPADVARLMSELSQEFVVSNNNNQRTVQSPYKKLAVKSIGDQDKQQLTKLFGADPRLTERKEVKPAAKTAPVAVLLPSSAATPSKEVRQFVKGRQPQPGTLQILIRIHQE